MSLTLKFILDQPLKQWLTGRYRGEDKYATNKQTNKKKEYLENKQNELKIVFHSF